MISRTAPTIVAEEFLPARAKLLEVAAILDRIDRAGGDDSDQMKQLRQAVTILLQDAEPASRAKTLQLLFSRDYDPNWKSRMEV